MIGTALLLLTISLSAGSPADSAWNAYLTGDFDRVETIVFDALKDSTLSNRQIARLYLALGCADAFRKRDAAATAEFEAALTLDPKINLTESDLPPPVWKLFAPVRKRIPFDTPLPPRDTLANRREQPEKVVVRSDTLWVHQPVYHESGSVVRSLILPGWGHLQEGQSRGWLFMAGSALLTAGWVTAGLQEQNARDDYLSARDPSDIQTTYDSYNQWTKVRQGFMYLTIAGYLVSQWDFFSNPPDLTLDPSRQTIGVSWKL